MEKSLASSERQLRIHLRMTQVNAASAEESASAGEELNAQVKQVKGMIQELIAIAGRSSGTYSGGDRVVDEPRHVAERLRDTTVDFLHHGPQATARALLQKERKPKNAMGGKRRNTHRGPEEVIPFSEGKGKEKDDGVLTHF